MQKTAAPKQRPIGEQGIKQCKKSKAGGAIQPIVRWEFNQLLPQHVVLEDLMGQQVAWFASKTKTLIGTIASTKVGRSWNYVILRRNALGKFQVCKIGQNYFDLGQTFVQFSYALVAAKNNHHAGYPSLE